MKGKKRSFVLYTDYEECVSFLSDEEAGKLFKHIFRYVNDKECGDIPGAAGMAFLFVKKQLDIDLAKWEVTREKRAEAGRKGGLANASKQKQKEANDTHKKEQKHKYGEYSNVLLTDTELEKLKSEYPDWENKIERLSSYVASTGRKYKSHYATIRNWSSKDVGNNGKSAEDTEQSWNVGQTI